MIVRLSFQSERDPVGAHYRSPPSVMVLTRHSRHLAGHRFLLLKWDFLPFEVELFSTVGHLQSLDHVKQLQCGALWI